MCDNSLQTSRPVNYVAATCILVLLSSLVFPAIAQTRDDSRENACIARCENLARGLLGHEEAKGFYPAASTAPFDAHPCNDSDDGDAGYSWSAQILPWIDEVNVYLTIANNSNKLRDPPLAVRLPEYAEGKPAASLQLEQFQCPAFSGEPVVDVGASDYRSHNGATPAITNYFALSSTHLVDQNGLWKLANTPTSAPRRPTESPPSLAGNGVLIFFDRGALERLGARKWTATRGTTQAGVQDGVSNTLMFTESREQAYAAWIDGQVAWVVAAWPQNPSQPRLIPEPANDQPQALGWRDSDKGPNFAALAPQAADVPDAARQVYLPQSMWSGTKDRRFGPSGNHPDVTMHAFADGHSRPIANSIDATVYLHLTTRFGREIVDDSVF